MTAHERVFAGGTEMGARMRALDWSQTPLGPVEGWPAVLRITVSGMLAAPYPVSLFWGPEFIHLYNDGYLPILGGKHPAALARPAWANLQEIWDVLGPMFEGVVRSDTARSWENQSFVLERWGALEETAFTFSLTPLHDENGVPVGVHNVVSETTRQVLAERRARVLRELDGHMPPTVGTPGVLGAAQQVLAQNGHDVPFALLYGRRGPGLQRLLCAGLVPGGSAAPETLALEEAVAPWPLAEVLRSGQEQLVELPSTSGVSLHAGPWPEPVRRVLLLPVSLGRVGEQDAVLVLGVSPRLPLNEGYGDFLRQLARQLASELARARFLEETREGRQVDAVAHRLARLIEHAPAFMCVLSGPRHVYELFNSRYQQLVGEDRLLLGRSVEEALPETVEQGFIRLLDEVYRTGVPFVGNEMRLLADRQGDGRRQEVILNLVYQPRRDAHGQVEGIDVFGFDVTEQVRARREAEALASRLLQSEERQRRVVEAVGAGLWELDGVTGRMMTDARMAELLGLPPGPVFGPDMLRECVHPEDREPVARALSRALAGENEGRYLMVFRIRGHEGMPERWVESRAQRWLPAEGQHVTLAGVMLDITERKRVELLRARQARLHTLSARLGQVIAHGSTVRELLQGCATVLVEGLEAVLVRLWLLDPTGTVLELGASDAPSVPPAGRTEVSTSHPLRVGDKLVGGVTLYSAQALPEDTLELLRQLSDTIALGVERLRAEEALRTQVDFEQKLVGIVSHDLRNPLSAILLVSTLLSRRELLDAGATKSALRIRSAAERAIRMVKILLDFTQARLGGGIPIDPRPANLHDVTRAVVEEVEMAWPTRQIDLRREGDGQGVFDADRLGQVVQNLVTNALKYSPEDSAVGVLTRGEGDGVWLTVGNPGEPIPEDKLTDIFEPLQRATARGDNADRSVGLGLYIVKSIVEAHGGSISVTSTPLEGTVFTVRLPRAPR